MQHFGQLPETACAEKTAWLVLALSSHVHQVHNKTQTGLTRGLLPCSVLAAGGPANEDDFQIGYEAGLWQLLDLFFLHHADLQHGAFPEVSTGSTVCWLDSVRKADSLTQACAGHAHIPPKAVAAQRQPSITSHNSALLQTACGQDAGHFFALLQHGLLSSAALQVFALWMLQHGAMFDSETPGFSQLHAMAQELLQDPRVDTNPAYWNTVQRLVLRGQVELAASLLAHHPVMVAGQDDGMADTVGPFSGWMLFTEHRALFRANRGLIGPFLKGTAGTCCTACLSCARPQLDSIMCNGWGHVA